MALTEAQVTTYYEAILQREPTDAQLAVGMALDTSTSLIDALIASNEAASFVFPLIQVYQAVFGRVPDADGLNFWVDAYRAGTSLETITEGFVASDEFQTTYGNVTDGSDPAFIQALYLNVLGRPGEPAGIAFWTAQTGISPAEVVRLFAIDTEFTNKAADPITDFLTDAANGVDGVYEGGLFDDLPAPGDVVGDTFTLTNAVGEQVVGTADADTFNAVLSNAGGTDTGTFNVGDRIDGAGGNDTFDLLVAGASSLPAGATVSNVETVNVNLAAGASLAAALNSSSFAGVQQLWQSDTDGTDNFADVTVGAGVTAGFRSTGDATGTAAAATVTAAAGVTSVAVALDGVLSGSNITLDETTANGLSTVSVSGSVASTAAPANALTVTSGAGDVDTLNVSLSSNTTVTLAGTAVDDYVTIDASGSTGNLTINLATAVVGASLESFVGGAGNDTVTINNADLDQESVSISLGGGNDALTFDLVSSAAGASAVTIAGGAGEDIFTFDATGGVGNLAAVTDNDDLLDNLVSISDFTAGEDAIDISLLVGGARVAQNIVNSAVNAAAPDDLFDAATAAFGTTAGGGATDVVVFQFGSNTYIGTDLDGDGALSADDALIELVGISTGDLSAANFVIA